MLRSVLAAVLMVAWSANAQVVLKLGTVDAQTSHSGVGAEGPWNTCASTAPIAASRSW